MDGNGRWAKQRGLSRILGHKKGAQRVKEIIRAAKEMGVKALTLFAFSTENWNRPRKEVKMIFSYFGSFLDANKNMLIKEKIRFNVIGRKDRLGQKLLERIEKVQTITKSNKDLILNIALDYGGRWDILRAAKKMANDVIAKRVSLSDIDETSFANYLCLSQSPEPDLLIRTSGELRISNFLLWQLAYGEFYFTDIFWPDFNKEALRRAIEEYSTRKRRFGRVS